MTTHLLAQVNLGYIGCIPGSPLCDQSIQSPLNSIFQLSNLISIVIGLLTLLAGLYFMFQIILAGFSWLSAGGDKAVIQTTQKKLQGAFTGLVIVVMAYGITYLIGQVLGFHILQFDTILYHNVHP